MSATVIFYTGTGFVVAADGRSSAPAGEASEFEVDTDTAQKIFHVTTRGYSLAYAVSGPLIANQDRSFDIVSECQNAVALLSKRYPTDERLFEDALSRYLKRYIGEAKRDGKIGDFPSMSSNPTSPELLTGIQMVGYIGDRAQWAEIKLSHLKRKICV